MNFFCAKFLFGCEIKIFAPVMCKNLTVDPKRPYGWTQNHETYQLLFLKYGYLGCGNSYEVEIF